VIAGKYVIEAPCGRGGLAIVYSAIQKELDRRVAIKMLLPEWAGDDEVVERFLREGRASTRIHSEHVVRVFDVGTMESGAPYLVLEYLQGQNLEDLVTQGGPIAIPTAVDWVLQASEAIAEAHAVGVVHRDLKPANLFLTWRADGSSCVKVIDFGLSKLLDGHRSAAEAKITLATEVMGSPHYMAPEQLRATRDADERVDLWALGTVLHELITGNPPFAGHTVPEICAAVLTQSPEPLTSSLGQVPEGLQRAVLRLLEKDPAARYANVAEMAQAISPYGTAAGRISCDRIGRVSVAHTSYRSEIRPPPPAPPPPLPRLDAATPGAAPWPQGSDVPRAPAPFRNEPVVSNTDPDVNRLLRAPIAPTRVLLGSVVMLAGLAAGVFMFMYESVHDGDARPMGVTAPQAPEYDTAGSAAPSPVATKSPATPRAGAPQAASVVRLAPSPPTTIATAARGTKATPPRPALALHGARDVPATPPRQAPEAPQAALPSTAPQAAPIAIPPAALPSTPPQADRQAADTSTKPPPADDLFNGRK
jgi:serine/threonine-protein kinase